MIKNSQTAILKDSKMYPIMDNSKDGKIKFISAKSILKRIIQKGGLYGKCAQMCYNDKEKAVMFILECYEQCHTNSVKEGWGEKLIKDIKQFKTYYLAYLANNRSTS